MNRLLKAASALFCALCIISVAGAQTTISAAKIYMGGSLIPAGTVAFTPVNSQGTAIPFAQSGGGLNSPTAFTGTITNGAIAGGFQVPDACLTTPANILYTIQITATGSGKSFTLQSVPNICGASWALDAYGPPAQTTNVQAVQAAYGTAAPPAHCNAPSTYTQNAGGGAFFYCVGGVYVQTGGSIGGSVSPIAGATADYRFVEGNGTTITDISGNSNTGTLGTGSLAPTWVPSGLAFAASQNVALPASLNNSRTFYFALYVNPLPSVYAGVNALSFPIILGSSLGNAALNLLLSPNLNAGYAYAPSVFVGGWKTTSLQLVSGFNVIAYTLGSGSGDVDHVYINGQEIGPYTAQGSNAGSQTGGNLFLGSSNIGPFVGADLNSTMYRAVFKSVEDSASTVQTTSIQILNEVAARGVATAPQPVLQAATQLLAVGDSITYGQGMASPTTQAWPYNLTLANQPPYVVSDYGIPGITQYAIVGSSANRDSLKCRSQGGPSVAIDFAGTNDLQGGLFPAAQAFTNVAAWIQAMKLAGCRVFVGTMISRTTDGSGVASVDALKDSYDALILSQAVKNGADGVIDFAANPNLGADGAFANTTYFQSDATHPTAAGQLALAAAASNALNYYFGSNSSNPAVITAATHTIASGEGYISANPTANQTLTLPDCTGPSGATYTVSNVQSAFTVGVVAGSASQLINGLALATVVTVPANSSVTFRDVPNPKTVSGCHWEK